MNQRTRFVVKIWSVAVVLGLATSWVSNYTNSAELLLLVRLAGTGFFISMLLYVSKMIKKNDEIIKSSHGFAQNIFDPYILTLTLKLCIIGWTVFALFDYMGWNGIDWITVFMLGVVIFPFASGLIPLRLNDNKNWRRR